jgi:hypothetical protein
MRRLKRSTSLLQRSRHRFRNRSIAEAPRHYDLNRGVQRIMLPLVYSTERSSVTREPLQSQCREGLPRKISSHA